MTTWKREFDEFYEAEQKKNDTIIACTLTDDEMNAEFDGGYGGNEGKPFTAWSDKYVYFPICYDGSEWVGRAPRNPCDEATEHQGGG